MKADPARRMSRPLAALGGHNQSRHLHPFLVNHAARWSRKCVVVRRVDRRSPGPKFRAADSFSLPQLGRYVLPRDLGRPPLLAPVWGRGLEAYGMRAGLGHVSPPRSRTLIGGGPTLPKASSSRMRLQKGRTGGSRQRGPRYRTRTVRYIPVSARPARCQTGGCAAQQHHLLVQECER